MLILEGECAEKHVNRDALGDACIELGGRAANFAFAREEREDAALCLGQYAEDLLYHGFGNPCALGKRLFKPTGFNRKAAAFGCDHGCAAHERGDGGGI